MKLPVILILLFASLLPQSSNAQQTNSFSCEMIKEKTVRTACISDRERATVAAKRKAIEDEKFAEIEKQKHAELSRIEAAKNAEKKELDDFVSASKEILTKNLKDPFSVHFRNLFIGHHINPRYKLFCGEVNAKNSYGAYSGFSFFYVLWTDGIAQNAWVQKENSDVATYKGFCENPVNIIKITKIP